MEKSEDLRKVVIGFYKSFENNDLAYLEETISRAKGTVCIGTDPDEWMYNYNEIMSAFKRQAEQIDYKNSPPKYIKYDPQVFVEGSVGWFYDDVSVQMKMNIFVDMRVTGVFHKENGSWKLVQMHASIGAPNVEIEGFSDMDIMSTS